MPEEKTIPQEKNEKEDKKKRAGKFKKFLLTSLAIWTIAINGIRCGEGDLIDSVEPTDAAKVNVNKKVNIRSYDSGHTDKEDAEIRDEGIQRDVEDALDTGEKVDDVREDIADNGPKDVLDAGDVADNESGDIEESGEVGVDVNDAEGDVNPGQDVLDAGEDTVVGDVGCTNHSIETIETSQAYAMGHKINSTRTYKQDIECVDDSEVVVSKKLVYDVFTASPPIQQGEIDKTLTIPWLDKNVQVTYYDPLSPSRIEMVSVIETQTLKNDNVYEIRGILIRVNEVNPGSVVLSVDGYEQTMSEGAYYILYGKYGLRVTNINPTAQTVDISILEPFIMSLSSGKYIKNEIGDKLIIDGSYWIVTDFETTNGITKIGAKRE